MFVPSDALKQAATEAAGNHRKFDSFAWFDRPDDSHNWAIFYDHHRDARLAEQSNWEAMEKLMAPFCEGDDPNAYTESHNHWACGWVEGYVIRVYKEDGRISAAFQQYAAIMQKLEDYPLLDESDHSERELDATFENIKNNCPSDLNIDLPEDWESDVYDWLSENDPGELESCDDQGGYPSDEAMKAAINGAGLAKPSDWYDG